MAITKVADLGALEEYLAPDINRDISEVVLHHSWSPTTTEYRGLATWQAIDRYHREVRGWKGGIGYHVGVGPSNPPTIWALRHYGRSGAHVLNRNRHTIGVCLIGNYDAEDPTPFLPLTAEVVRAICDRFNLGAGAIRFHREFADKTCPGLRIHQGTFRDMVFDAGGGSDPDDDTVPAVPSLAVVLGGNIIQCAPRLVGGRLTVDVEQFANGLAPDKLTAEAWIIELLTAEIAHVNTMRMFVAEAAPWFAEHGWVIDGRVWRDETIPGLGTVHRLYPQRVEWLTG